MSYPKSLQYLCKSLSGYSTNCYKLVPSVSQATSVPNGGIISFQLPENSIVNLDTLRWHFTVNMAGANSYPSKHVETLATGGRVSVDINGITIDGGVQNTSLLFRRLADHLLDGSKEVYRSVLALGSGAVAPTSSNTYATTSNCVYNWTGFLGTVQPRCVSTGILGSVRVTITLPGTEVLQSNGTAITTNGFTLSNNYFAVDCISINDGIYNEMLRERLASGVPIEMPYQRWYQTSPGQVSSLAQTTMATISTGSLDMLLGMYQLAGNNPTGNGADSTTLGSAWFTSGSSNLTSSQFFINGVAYPQFLASPPDCFAQTACSLNMAQETVGGGDKNMNSLANWQNKFYSHIVRLNHPHSSDDRIKSGIDLRGTNAQVLWTTNGTDSNVIPFLFLGMTSVLEVGSFKQLNVIQ